jgi:hypothetical protein
VLYEGGMMKNGRWYESSWDCEDISYMEDTQEWLWNKWQGITDAIERRKKGVPSCEQERDAPRRR